MKLDRRFGTFAVTVTVSVHYVPGTYFLLLLLWPIAVCEQLDFCLNAVVLRVFMLLTP